MDQLNQTRESTNKLIVFSLDKDYKYLYFNKNHFESMNHLWGVDIELGNSMLDYIGLSENRKKAKINFDKALKGEDFSVVVEYGDESLDRKYYEDFYTPMYEEKGGIKGLTVFVNDITDRIKAEDKLKSSENLYKAVVSSLSEGLLVKDDNDKIIFANESASEILGLTKEQLLGKNSFDPRWKALKEDGTELEPEKFPSVRTQKTGKSFNEQIMNIYVGKESRKIISVNTRPIKYREGSVSGVVSSFVDITEQEKSKNILRENESRLKHISDSIQGAVIRYKLNQDLTDQMLYISKGAELLWEIEIEKILQDVKILWDQVHPDDLAGMKQSVLYSAENLQKWNHEWRIILPNNRVKWINGRGLPTRSKDGSTIWDTLMLDITKQKNALVQLDENQKLIESINQNISEAIYRSNVKNIFYVNKAFQKMFGYEKLLDIRNMNPENFYKYPEDRAFLIEELNKHGFFENEEIVFKRKDGSDFIGLISSRIYQNHNGESFWDGAIRDVTAERKASEKIKESQQLLESINKNINEAIYRTSNRDGFVYINEEFVKMFGYDGIEEILSGDPIDLYKNPEDRKTLGKELIANGAYTNKEVQFKRKDESIFWGSMSSIMLEGVDGEIFFDGAIRDITSQKQAEFSLKKQAEMQRLLRNISSIYINLPLDKVNEAINKSLESLCVFANSDRAFVFDVNEVEKCCVNTFEFVKKSVREKKEGMQYIPLVEIPELMEPFSKGEIVNIPDVSKMKNSFYKNILTEFNVKSTIAVPIMQKKKCVGFVGFHSIKNKKEFDSNEISLLKIFSDMMLNIRTRTQKQKELKQLLNTTTNQNKRLKDFSFITSHNIRSSVTNIIGLTNLILDEPQNKSYVELLKKTAEKLDTTLKNINQLLHFENSYQTKELIDCNLVEVINRSLELNENKIKEKRIKVKINVPEDLTLKVIPAFLDSIIYNLLNNAFKYGVTNESKIIEITYEDSEHFDIVYIKDKGWGMNLDKFSDRLFKLGSRLHTRSEGQGFGLYMTKQQIEELGGSIDVYSKLDEGATFVLKFPKEIQSSISSNQENETNS